MNHEAIYSLYPQVITIDDGTGAFDKDGNKVEIDLDAVDAWVNPNAYKSKRASKYPPIIDQLDLLYHDIKSGNLENGNWIAAIESVKQQFPKPQ